MRGGHVGWLPSVALVSTKLMTFVITREYGGVAIVIMTTLLVNPVSNG